MQHEKTQSVEMAKESMLPHVAMLLVTVWLVLVFYAFWWFEYRLLQPFISVNDNKAVFFDGEKTMQLMAASLVPQDYAEQQGQPLATVLHFWDPECPCNKLNESHVNEIIKDYGEKGVNFIIVTNAENGLVRAQKQFPYSAVVGFETSPAKALSPPSSPAAVVLDGDGIASYFGPYSVGARCLSDNGTFVETILDSLLAGKHRKQINTAAIGCFCDWNKEA